MRNITIDIVRGFAVISMMFLHTLDFFSNSLHLYGDFWLNSGLNQMNWMPIFFVTVGVSLGFPTRHPKRIAKRALLYIALGAFLFFWVGSLDADVIFIIGFYTLLSLPLIYYFKKHRLTLAVSIFIASFVITEMLKQNQIIIYPISYGFTLWVSLPFIFFGYYLSDAIINNNPLPVLKTALGLTPFAAVSMLYFPVSFYDQTLSLVLFDCAIICLIYLLAMKLRNRRAMKFFAFFGQHPLLFFIFPWLIVYKTLSAAGMLRAFDNASSLALTITVLALFSLLVSKKTQLVEKLPKKASMRRRARCGKHLHSSVGSNVGIDLSDPTTFARADTHTQTGSNPAR
jgi:hypothetical protein